MKYISSYPRSGNTYARFLLANYLHDGQVNFDNIDTLIPERGKPILGWKKTHKSKPHSLYLVRDPRQVAVSYYQYQLKMGQTTQSFDKWLLSWVLYGDRFGTWEQHVKASSGKYLRYKDLVFDPSRLFDIAFNGQIDHKRMFFAIKNSSFINMRKLEEQSTQPHLNQNPDIKFVRKGKVAEWADVLEPEQVQLIEYEFGETMKELGYL